MITCFERGRKLTENGIPTPRAISFLEALTRQANLREIRTGTGTPEGSVTADPTTLYMDESGTAGNILYIKKSGTGNTGWILV